MASAHYFVDDDSITRSVPDNYVAWSVGGAKYSDCAETGGGKLYGIANNYNSISIEMCDTKRDGIVMASEKTMENTAVLCRELMEKYHIDVEHVIRHFDVNGKHCPAYFMDNATWERFRDRIRKGGFETDRTYKATQDCLLRKASGHAGRKVRYSELSDAVKKKCRNWIGAAVFRKGSTFRLVKTRMDGTAFGGRWPLDTGFRLCTREKCV